jgi:hypothetical protein
MKTETEMITDWLERNEIEKIPTKKKTSNQKIKIRKKLRSKKGHRKKGSRK